MQPGLYICAARLAVLSRAFACCSNLSSVDLLLSKLDPSQYGQWNGACLQDFARATWTVGLVVAVFAPFETASQQRKIGLGKMCFRCLMKCQFHWPDSRGSSRMPRTSLTIGSPPIWFNFQHGPEDGVPFKCHPTPAVLTRHPHVGCWARVSMRNSTWQAVGLALEEREFMLCGQI